MYAEAGTAIILIMIYQARSLSITDSHYWVTDVGQPQLNVYLFAKRQQSRKMNGSVII